MVNDTASRKLVRSLCHRAERKKSCLWIGVLRTCRQILRETGRLSISKGLWSRHSSALSRLSYSAVQSVFDCSACSSGRERKLKRMLQCLVLSWARRDSASSLLDFRSSSVPRKRGIVKFLQEFLDKSGLNREPRDDGYRSLVLGSIENQEMTEITELGR